jgi:hypothetical protein
MSHAVQLEGDALWDGLFSDNPPLDDLVRRRIGDLGDESITLQLRARP